jgi:hypothetical protein
MQVCLSSPPLPPFLFTPSCVCPAVGWQTI